jgi:hypothetical protein
VDYYETGQLTVRMTADHPALRMSLAVLLMVSDIALAASLPVLFFLPSIGILMLLAFPAGLALARWQYGQQPWAQRQRAATAALWFLLGLVLLFFLVVLAGRVRPDSFEAAPALMLLGIVWAGLSTYAIGLVSMRATWKPTAPD